MGIADGRRDDRTDAGMRARDGRMLGFEGGGEDSRDSIATAPQRGREGINERMGSRRRGRDSATLSAIDADWEKTGDKSSRRRSEAFRATNLSTGTRKRCLDDMREDSSPENMRCAWGQSERELKRTSGAIRNENAQSSGGEREKSLRHEREACWEIDSGDDRLNNRKKPRRPDEVQPEAVLVATVCDEARTWTCEHGQGKGKERGMPAEVTRGGSGGGGGGGLTRGDGSCKSGNTAAPEDARESRTTRGDTGIGRDVESSSRDECDKGSEPSTIGPPEKAKGVYSVAAAAAAPVVVAGSSKRLDNDHNDGTLDDKQPASLVSSSSVPVFTATGAVVAAAAEAPETISKPSSATPEMRTASAAVAVPEIAIGASEVKGARGTGAVAVAKPISPSSTDCVETVPETAGEGAGARAGEGADAQASLDSIPKVVPPETDIPFSGVGESATQTMRARAGSESPTGVGVGAEAATVRWVVLFYHWATMIVSGG